MQREGSFICEMARLSKMSDYHNLRGNHLFRACRRRAAVRHLSKTISIFSILILALSISIVLLQPISADPVSEFSVQTSANVLRAGSNNTVTMHIQGISKLLSNLDVSLAVPPPLVLFGDNHWRLSSFGPGQTIDAQLTLFAPASAAGNSYQATVSGVYKEAGETTYSQETHTVGFLVRGWIDFVIYDLTVSPSPAGPGTTVTISGSLLNRGISSAMFTNVTIKPSTQLILSSESASYMGQVDPNAPAPFSLSADLQPSTPDGPYIVTLVVYYQDDLHTIQQTQTFVQIDVSITALHTETTTRQTGPITVFLDYSQYIIALVLLVVLILLVRRFRKRRKKPI